MTLIFDPIIDFDSIKFCREFLVIKMSNAFEKLMSSKGQAKSMAGRPMHEHWSGYKRMDSDGKVVAKCFNCLKVLSNTAKERLMKHR